MSEDSEINWHRNQIEKNHELLRQLMAGNSEGAGVFPETNAEIDRLIAQIEQSELIVAAHEKKHPPEEYRALALIR